MTIADLANALRSIPRDSLVLIDTPDGLKRLQVVERARVGERQGRIMRHVEFERCAVILYAER